MKILPRQCPAILGNRPKQRALEIVADAGRIKVRQHGRCGFQQGFSLSLAAFFTHDQIPIEVGALDVADPGVADGRAPGRRLEVHEEHRVVPQPGHGLPVRRVQELDRFLLAQAGRRVLLNRRRFDRLDITNVLPRNQAPLAELLICATQDRECPSNRRRRLAGREEGRLVEAEIIAGDLKWINAALAHLRDERCQVGRVCSSAVR